MDVVTFSTYFQKSDLIALGYPNTDLFKNFINLFSDNKTSIFCYKYKVIH